MEGPPTTEGLRVWKTLGDIPLLGVRGREGESWAFPPLPFGGQMWCGCAACTTCNMVMERQHDQMIVRMRQE